MKRSRVGEPDRLPQQRLAAAQRQPAQVVPVQVEQIEQVVGDRDAGRPRRLRVVGLHPLLQTGEAGALPLKGHDLAIDHEVVTALSGQAVDQLRIAAVQGFAVAAEQPDPVTVAERQGPLAVELALEQPFPVGEPLVGEPGQDRLAPLRVGSRHDALPLSLVQRLEQIRHRSDRHAARGPPCSARSLTVRPLNTDRGWLAVGRRRASAASSFSLISSQRSSLPSATRWSA